MDDKLTYIPNYDIQNYPVDFKQWLKRLNTQLYEPTDQNSIKVPKVVKPTEKKNVI